MSGIFLKLKCGDIMTSIRKTNLRVKNGRNPFTIGKSLGIYPMFSDVEKIIQESTDNTIKCKCGNSMSIPACKDFAICTWCGKKIYNKTKNHFKYKLRKEVNNMACGKGKKKK